MKKNLIIILCVLLGAFCFAQPVTIKIASVAPSRSPWEVEQKNLALEWSKITNGNVRLQFYDVNALGGENGVIQKMRSVRPGQRSPIDGAILTSIGMYELAPESNVLTMSVPFLFRDQDEITYVLNETADEINKAVEDQGFVLLGWLNVGMAHFLTKEEVRMPNHLKSIKLSVGGFTSPELGRAFQKAGYTTEDVPNEKIMSSIKSPNGVQGLYTIPMYAFATQYYKSLPYVVAQPLCPVMATFVISQKSWEKIPEQYRDALMKTVEVAEQKLIAVQQKNDSDYLKKMEENGATLVYLTKDELTAWETTLTTDAEKMAADSDVKVINYEFYKRIENDLNKFRAGR